VGFLAIQELHGCHFIVALLDTVLSSLYGLSYLALRFPVTLPPPCPCSVLPQSAPRGGFSPLHYRQARHRIGSVAPFPGRPYYLVANCIGSKQAFQPTAPTASGQACFHAPRRTGVLCMSGLAAGIGEHTGGVR